MLDPKDIGYNNISPSNLQGGKTLDESAEIFVNILKNEGTNDQKSAVLVNSGIAIYCALNLSSISEGIEIARESLESGKAYNCLKKFIES